MEAHAAFKQKLEPCVVLQTKTPAPTAAYKRPNESMDAKQEGKCMEMLLYVLYGEVPTL